MISFKEWIDKTNKPLGPEAEPNPNGKAVFETIGLSEQRASSLSAYVCDMLMDDEEIGTIMVGLSSEGCICSRDKVFAAFLIGTIVTKVKEAAKACKNCKVKNKSN